ncbi:toxic anion resistance protein, partial [Streptomyces sp. NPDC003236]
VQVLRSTTEDLIRGNAEMLATQSGEIQRIAADPAVGAETLRTAFQQIYRTLDAIDTYKVQATESMAATVESLTAELQQASTHLERSRSAGERAMHAAVATGIIAAVSLIWWLVLLRPRVELRDEVVVIGPLPKAG